MKYIVDAEFSSEDDPTARALQKFFGSKEFTEKEAIDFVTDMSEDREYAKWEFEQLLAAGYIKETR